MGFNNRPAAQQNRHVDDTNQRVIPVLWPLCLCYAISLLPTPRIAGKTPAHATLSRPERRIHAIYYQLTVSAKEPLLHYRHAHRLHVAPIQSFHHVQRFIPQCPSWVQLPRLCCDAKGIQCRLQKTRKGYCGYWSANECRRCGRIEFAYHMAILNPQMAFIS
jgi:hypothetical protein